MSKQPPIHELQFLKLCRNHGELSGNLAIVGLPTPGLLEYAKYICVCWYRLSEEHLSDAEAALASNSHRAAFSRSYYAVYNASKSTRYVWKGTVSLKGDDHNSAASLPDDFPDVVDWSAVVSTLYQHRLRADYDNWSDTLSSQTLTPTEAVERAARFLKSVKSYMNNKYGVEL